MSDFNPNGVWDKLSKLLQETAEDLRGKALVRAADSGKDIFLERIIDTNLSAPPGPSKNLHARSGKLRQSMRAYVAQNKEGEVAVVFANNRVYMPPHEFGATINLPEIRPVNKKALMIPIGLGARLGLAFVAQQPAKMRRGLRPKVINVFAGRGDIIFRKEVRAHTVTIPERAPIRRALNDPGLQQKFGEHLVGDIVANIGRR